MTATAARAQRKQDLLLASAAVRTQALADASALAGRADAVATRLLQVRAVLAHPAVPLAAAMLGTGVARLLLRSGRRRPWLRWAWLAWRAWRVASPWLRPAAPRR